MTQADLAATGQPVPQPLSVVRVTCRWCHWCPVRCSPARVENFSPVFKFGTHHGLVTVGLWASKRHWEQCGRGSSGSLFCYLFGRPSLEWGHQTSFQCDAQLTQMPQRARDNVGGGKSKNPATFLRTVKWKSIISCGFSLCFLGTCRSSCDGELCRGALPKMEKSSSWMQTNRPLILLSWERVHIPPIGWGIHHLPSNLQRGYVILPWRVEQWWFSMQDRSLKLWNFPTEEQEAWWLRMTSFASVRCCHLVWGLAHAFYAGAEFGGGAEMDHSLKMYPPGDDDISPLKVAGKMVDSSFNRWDMDSFPVPRRVFFGAKGSWTDCPWQVSAYEHCRSLAMSLGSLWSFLV